MSGMRRYVLPASLSLLSAFACVNAHATESLPPPDTGVTVSTGIRVDNFKWNIAGDSSGGNPNILSELTWTDLEIFQLKLRGRAAIGNRLYLRGVFDYGWIYGGDNQDSDFRGDDRTREFSRSNNKSDKGEVWDASAGIGFRNRLNLGAGTLDISPVAGYSYHRQNLWIINGVQTIPALGPFSGLNSSYSARWHGPWLGIDLDYNLNRLAFYGSFEYHYANYKAEADWNLRSDFAHPKSFEHHANGRGLVGTLGADYAIGKNWAIDGSFDLQDWETSHGVDRTFFTSGVISDTQLNEVKWDSYAVMLGLKYLIR